MNDKLPAADVADQPVKRAAAELAVGDRIAEGFLPTGEPADVLFLDHYTHGGMSWVLVVYRFADGEPYANSFAADRQIRLESVADNGMGYSREADDPTPVIPARREPHFGGVVDGGQLVDETERPPPAGVLQVLDGHLVHECCGKLDDAAHFNFCKNYQPAATASEAR